MARSRGEGTLWRRGMTLALAVRLAKALRVDLGVLVR